MEMHFISMPRGEARHCQFFQDKASERLFLTVNKLSRLFFYVQDTLKARHFLTFKTLSRQDTFSKTKARPRPRRKKPRQGQGFKKCVSRLPRGKTSRPRNTSLI